MHKAQLGRKKLYAVACTIRGMHPIMILLTQTQVGSTSRHHQPPVVATELAWCFLELSHFHQAVQHMGLGYSMLVWCLGGKGLTHLAIQHCSPRWRNLQEGGEWKELQILSSCKDTILAISHGSERSQQLTNPMAGFLRVSHPGHLNKQPGYEISQAPIYWLLVSHHPPWKKCEQTLLFIAMHYQGCTSLEVIGWWGLLLPPCLLIMAVQQPGTSNPSSWSFALLFHHEDRLDNNLYNVSMVTMRAHILHKTWFRSTTSTS